MAKVRGAIVIDTERCKGCDLCVVACPTDVIKLHEIVNSKGYHPAYPAVHDACIACNNCALVCPDMCITVYRLRPEKKKVSV